MPENSPLKEPAQLKGKRVGIPGWLNTAGLWARGILGDEYEVKAQDIHWIARRKAPLDLSMPAGTQLDVVPGEGSLAARLLKGEFDAIIVPDFPTRTECGGSFPIRKRWSRIYRRTGIFPTSHAITFHKTYFAKHPAAAREMFDACYEAKRLALRDDADATYSNFVWNRQVWEEQRAVMGPDSWKYGIKGNEKVLNTIIRYAGEQGLLKNKVTIEDLFVPINEPQT